MAELRLLDRARRDGRANDHINDMPISKISEEAIWEKKELIGIRLKARLDSKPDKPIGYVTGIVSDHTPISEDAAIVNAKKLWCKDGKWNVCVLWYNKASSSVQNNESADENMERIVITDLDLDLILESQDNKIDITNGMLHKLIDIEPPYPVTIFMIFIDIKDKSEFIYKYKAVIEKDESSGKIYASKVN